MTLSKFFLPTLLIITISLSFTPYLSAGFFADDAMNSQINLVAKKQSMSVFEFTKKINSNWMVEVGRFFPLGFLGSYFFYSFFPKEIPARLAQMFLVFLNIIIFSFIIKKISGSNRMALLFIPVILTHFQIRDFYDPIAGYAPFMQMMFFYTIGSIVFFWSVLNGAGFPYLLLSGFLFSASLITYELSLVFFGILALLAWEKEKSIYRTLYQLRLHIILLAGYVIFIFYLRLHRNSLYQGTEVALNLRNIFQAYIHQLGATIPLSHFTFNKYFTLGNLTESGQNFTIAIGYAIATFLFLRVGYKTKESNFHCKGKKDLILISLGLLLFPPFVVAFSSRWQASVSPGMGYIPVYFSYFGSALFITYFLNNLCSSTDKRKKYQLALITAVLTVIGFFNHLVNQLAVEQQNRSFKYPRQEVEASYNAGLLSEMPIGSIVVSPKLYSWNSIFLTDQSVKKIDSIRPIEDLRQIAMSDTNGKKIYYLDFCNTLNRQNLSEWVLLSELIISQKSTGSEFPLIELTNPLLYAKSESGDKSKLVVSCGSHSEILNLTVGAPGKLYTISPLTCSFDKLSVRFQ